MLSIIVATARNEVIGRANTLPWNLPADLAYFKRITVGHPIIMGRSTYTAIGRPLPGRRNIVVTRDPTWRAAGVEIALSVGAALDRVAVDDAFVIGGATLYAQSLPSVQRVYRTEIDATIAGDRFFPALDPAAWCEVAREHRARDEKNIYDMDFVILERRSVSIGGSLDPRA